MNVAFIDAASVARLANYPELIREIDAAFRSDAIAPQRGHFDCSSGGNSRELLTMPVWDRGSIATKLVTVMPNNGTQGLPSIMGVIVLFDGETGAPEAVLDAGEITARRTAAASALASRHLSRENSHRLLVVGTGRLAPHLVAAHGSVRELSDVTICGRNAASTQSVVDQLKGSTKARVRGCGMDQLPDVVPEADIISTATRSTQPLIQGSWLLPGQHLDLVGGYRTDMREVDDDSVRRASIFVDTHEGALTEAGDIVQPIEAGVIEAISISAELSDLCRGRHNGRTDDDEITLFKSVGTAIEDLAAASLVLRKSKEQTRD